MKEELVLLAAKAGFRQHLDVYDYYNWLCDLQKWLREDHHIEVVIRPMIDFGGKFAYQSKVCEVRQYLSGRYSIEPICHEEYNDIIWTYIEETYEQALESGLKKALEKL